MKKTLRRFLFWCLVALFLISTPVAVLYSQGYRFDQYRMIFIHSGSVTIKSLPTNPTIYVNGELAPSGNLDIINNSVTIGGLRPGNYSIRVAAEGYDDWEKDIDVHSGLSSEYWNVVLVPKNPLLNKVTSDNVFKFFPAPSGKMIAYAEDRNDRLSLFVADVKQNEFLSIFSAENVEFTESAKENIEWNIEEDTLLCPVLRSTQPDYLITGIESGADQNFLSDLTGISKLRKARWSPKDRNTVYFLASDDQSQEESLYRFDIGASKLEKVADGLAVYDLSQNSIYFTRENNILFKSDLEGNNTSQLTSTAFTNESAGKNASLVVYDDERQAFMSENGDLYVRNDGKEDLIKKLASGISGFQFSDDGKKLLYWGKNDISVMFLRKWEVQPFREENEIQSVMRLATPVTNVFWYRDYEHVFFSSQNKTRIIELDPRDHRISNEIMENNLDDFPAAYDSGKGIYYFLREAEGTKKIFYFNLPERIGIFG